MQDILIQSKVIDIFPKFKMAAAAILDFQFIWIWPFRRVGSVVFVFCTKFGWNILSSLKSTHICFRPSFDDVTRINFQFRLLVTSLTWSSLHGRDASSHENWCRYIYPIRSYWYFFEIKDGGRRHLGFVWVSHGTTHEASLMACLGLKVLFTAPKFQFLGDFTPKI